MWRCKQCHKRVADSFEVCWKCGTSRSGVEDPAFRSDVDAGPASKVAAVGYADQVVSPVLVADDDEAGPGTALARFLVWVFRALFLIGGLWGVAFLKRVIETPKSDSAQVFTAVIVAVSVAAVPLAIAEGLRLCVLIEGEHSSISFALGSSVNVRRE